MAKKINANLHNNDCNFVELIKKLKDANPKRWSFDKEIHKIGLSEDEFRSIYLNEKANAIFNVAVYKEYQKHIFLFYINKYKKCADEVLKKSKIDDFKICLVESGYINDIKIFNKLANSKSTRVKLFSVKYCDFKTLNKLAKDSNKKVRQKALDRLGPVESLDMMLTDSSWEIRLKGIKSAPFGYKKLSKMVGEISKKVFIELVKKIDDSSIPMLLGNRNLKYIEVKSILQERLDEDLIIN